MVSKHSTFHSQWVRYWQPRPLAHLRLFCFPYAGGGASVFRSWSEHFPPEIEVCPVQLPGREARLHEKPFSRMDELISALLQGLHPFLDRPYAFFGHSMGSLVSFELVRAIRDEGRCHSPVRLCVAGHRAPQIPDPGPITYNLPEPAFIEELYRLKGTPKEVLQHSELLQLVLPLLRADFALCETYLYTQKPPLACPISVFGGSDDDEVSRDDLVAWNEQTTAACKLRLLAGDHFFLHTEQAALLQALTHDLLEDLV